MKSVFLAAILNASLITALADTLNPADARAASELLQKKQEKLLQSPSKKSADYIHQLLDLGLWDRAKEILLDSKRSKADFELVRARYYYLNNAFKTAEDITTTILERNPGNRRARRLKVKLFIQAWQLPEAEITIKDLLAGEPMDAGAQLLLGELKLLQRDFDAALSIAEKIYAFDSLNDDALLLKAKAYLSKGEQSKAKRTIERSLKIEPLNADARFYYGYSIWKEGDPRKSGLVSDQWDLALRIHPLHYLTHWHFGNAQTHKNYTRYAKPEPSAIEVKLRKSDSLFAGGKLRQAIVFADSVRKLNPFSVLPDMFIGSAYYMAYPWDGNTRLDSAEKFFRKVLTKKPHYRAAHNGLAAVIKQKQINYLSDIDVLESAIRQADITNSKALYSIFSDIQYYPGERVEKMVWTSLHTGKAYLPMMERLGIHFFIPPLHVDFSLAIHNKSLLQQTSFNQRRWMDIYGMGSGATGIEYLERGTHMERNVLLHEFAHLFHIELFTDREKRRIRQLYYDAAENAGTLDQYSAENEHEYFAQGYPAYFSSVKIHPLTLKSLNTREVLREKDPALYSFIDSLVSRQTAYLNGDTMALKSNWAQAYINLFKQESKKSVSGGTILTAEALLDTAFRWDMDYIPAYLNWARLKMEGNRFLEARQAIYAAMTIDSTYAPIYTTMAELAEDLGLKGYFSKHHARAKQLQYLKKANALENDWLEKAVINEKIRNFHLEDCSIPEAILVAGNYARNAKEISTHLKEHKVKALAQANFLKASLGYAGEPLNILQELVNEYPQNFNLKALYAEALAINGKYGKAIRILEGAQRMLSSTGEINTDYMVKIGEYYLGIKDTASARHAIRPLLEKKWDFQGDKFVFARVLAGVEEISRSDEILKNARFKRVPLRQAEYLFSLGVLNQSRGALKEANEAFEAALNLNPYHNRARMQLIKNYIQTGQKNQAIKTLQSALKLPLPPGPEFNGIIYRYISHN